MTKNSETNRFWWDDCCCASQLIHVIFHQSQHHDTYLVYCVLYCDEHATARTRGRGFWHSSEAEYLQQVLR